MRWSFNFSRDDCSVFSSFFMLICELIIPVHELFFIFYIQLRLSVLLSNFLILHIGFKSCCIYCFSALISQLLKQISNRNIVLNMMKNRLNYCLFEFQHFEESDYCSCRLINYVTSRIFIFKLYFFKIISISKKL